MNPETGMLINISEIKSRAGDVLHDGYDHKFLNEDNPAFADQVPTAENIARQLFRRNRAALPRFRCTAGRVSPLRDGATNRDVLRGWPLRREPLDRLFSRAANDVAAPEQRGK